MMTRFLRSGVSIHSFRRESSFENFAAKKTLNYYWQINDTKKFYILSFRLGSEYLTTHAYTEVSHNIVRFAHVESAYVRIGAH